MQLAGWGRLDTASAAELAKLDVINSICNDRAWPGVAVQAGHRTARAGAGELAPLPDAVRAVLPGRHRLCIGFCGGPRGHGVL